jgi:DNA replication protein DnaC
MNENEFRLRLIANPDWDYEHDPEYISDCEKRRIDELLRQKAEELLGKGISVRYHDANIDEYPVKDERQKKVIEFFREYVKKPARQMENLIIFGPKGTGKTHMVCALVRSIKFAKRYKLLDIVTRVKNSYSRSSEETELDIISELSNASVLVIDEVGRQGGTQFEGNLMFQIIDTRYENLLPTILVSNLPVTGDISITSYLGATTMDRINENAFEIACEWTSYRRAE